MSRKDNEDDVSTQLITRFPWLPPVKRVEDLPLEDVPDQCLCFVEADGEEEVWQMQQGQWTRIDQL